jgi:chromosome segregation protein
MDFSMRLKSLELHGYKTFASQTLFEFAGAVTAIVGPNGSGKSNVADGLRWVLGEQTYSLMRAKKTEDMIYAGSESRSRSGMASVTVVFDNHDGWLPVDYSEVAIARRAYRDGQNEYLLNKQRVRLRDISELLAKCGLAERTYTIIGQGLVDAALALKAEERRRLFEEAAGIGLYRSRREEAMHRLDITKRNLERVQDILTELEPRLRSLERQSKRASEYEKVKSELRVQLRIWYGYQWIRAQKDFIASKKNAKQKEIELDRIRKVQDELSDKLHSLRDRTIHMRHDLAQWHRQLTELYNQRESNGLELAVVKERQRSLAEQLHQSKTFIKNLEEQIERNQEGLKVAIIDKELIEAELSTVRKQGEHSKAEFLKKKNRREELEVDFQSVKKKYQELVEKKSRLHGRINNLKENKKRLSDEVLNYEKQIDEVKAHFLSIKGQWEENEPTLENIQDDRIKVEKELHTHREHLTNLTSKRDQLSDNLNSLMVEIEGLKTKLDIIEQAEKNLTGYASGARLLLEAARDRHIDGVRGSLDSLIDVPTEIEVAVASVLGEFMDAVIFDKKLNFDQALDLVHSNSARASLLSMDLNYHQVFSSKFKNSLQGISSFGDNQILGIAADMISSSDEFRPIMNLLLGNVLVVKDRSIAHKILDESKDEFKGLFNAGVVTIKGEFYLAQGAVLAGRGSKSGILGRKQDKKALVEKLKSSKVKLISIQKQLVKIEQELDELLIVEKRMLSTHQKVLELEDEVKREKERIGFESKQSSHQSNWLETQREKVLLEFSQIEEQIKIDVDQLSSLQNDITSLEAELIEKENLISSISLGDLLADVNDFETKIAVSERAYLSANERVQERTEILEDSRQEFTGYQDRLKQIIATISELENEKSELLATEKDINNLINQKNALIDPTEQAIQKCEKEEKELQITEGEARIELNLAEHHNTQAKISLVKNRETLESLKRRIEEDFGLVEFGYTEEISGPKPLPLEGLVEQLPDIDELPPGLEEELKRSRSLLKRIGPVNPEAQNEYLEVNERFSFLNEQLADLRKAETDIRHVIVELDNLMEKSFQETFESVAEEFRQIFTRLFGGGVARLVLTDPENLTISGIDIEARLPGRREQGLALLSGGERSLAAVALVFALLKVSPTPFCILDEVDAMLDESNVNRFSDLLKELSLSTQFIIITHNPNTLQVADVIYGVTMGKDSTSQIVSLKVDQYEGVDIV